MGRFSLGSAIGRWWSAAGLLVVFVALSVTSAVCTAFGQAPVADPAAAPPSQAASPAATTESRDLKAVQQKTAVAVTIPRSYALVVGISAYKNLPATAQLEFPNRDAEDIYAALISPEGGQFPPENVHKLINERATIANIKHELEVWLPSVTQDNDRVLIYFAGHGFVSGGKG